MVLFNFGGITYAVSSYAFCAFCVICASCASYASCAVFCYPSFGARRCLSRMAAHMWARVAAYVVPLASVVPTQFPHLALF